VAMAADTHAGANRALDTARDANKAREAELDPSLLEAEKMRAVA